MDDGRSAAGSKERKDLEEVTLEGMRITKTGRGTYLAHSTTKADTAYAVDISHYGGLGSCSCDDFRFRRFPKWKEVRKPLDSLRCRHIRRTRNYVLDAIIAYYAKPQSKKETD